MRTQGDEPTLALSITVDFGRDLGQNFGSLFGVRDAGGRVVAGAGFMAVYNTRFRMDRHTVQFFVKPPPGGGGSEPFRLTRLPRPDDDCGLYMFDYGQRLFAANDTTKEHFHEWDPAARAWRRAAAPVEGVAGSSEGVAPLGSQYLRFAGGGAEYGDRTILPSPAAGRYHHFYYAHGRLYFYYTNPAAAESGGFTRIYACPWTPESTGPIELTRADMVAAPNVGEVSWAFGQLGRQVITVSNLGGVYVHNGRRWRVLRPSSPGVSFQVYSMLNYYDRLLLGHYPSGEVLEFDGRQLKQREGWPPRLPGVSASVRECQTLAIYRGELFAGVWPWAEVWRYDRDADRWHSAGRLFTHPEPTDKANHPYEEESVKRGVVLNHWGQRVTSMVPLGGALMLSTSAKGNHRWDPKFDFLSESQRKEYGAVLELTLPGNLAASIRWKQAPTELEFLVFRDRMVIRQDGRQIASGALEPALARQLKPASIQWGSGIFGPLEGRIVRRAGDSALRTI